MKIRYFILTIIVLVIGSIVTGYNSNKLKTTAEANENVGPAIEQKKDAQTVAITDWQQFKIDAKVKINANEARIDKFKDEMESTSNNVKAGYSKEIARLEEQNNVLNNKLNEFKYEGEEKWEVFKNGFNHDMDVLGKSINDLLTKRH